MKIIKTMVCAYIYMPNEPEICDFMTNDKVAPMISLNVPNVRTVQIVKKKGIVKNAYGCTNLTGQKRDVGICFRSNRLVLISAFTVELYYDFKR